jgi:hypothetical protein
MENIWFSFYQLSSLDCYSSWVIVPYYHCVLVEGFLDG